jgi:hypothetical protein
MFPFLHPTGTELSRSVAGKIAVSKCTVMMGFGGVLHQLVHVSALRSWLELQTSTLESS